MSSSEVQIVQEHLLNCKDPSILAGNADPWKLGPFDYNVAPIIPTAIIFLYEHLESGPTHAKSSSLIPVDILQQATEALLNYYPHLTGRLTINEKDQTPQVEHLGTGSLFTVAKCSRTLDSYKKGAPSQRLLISDLPDAGNALIPPISFSDEEAHQGVTFGVKHTRFACGSVAVGISVLHVVADAAGFFQLSRNLAEVYRQLEAGEASVALRQPPIITSYHNDLTAQLTEQQRREALSFSPRYHELSGNQPQQDPAPSPPSESVKVTGKVFRFNRSVLNELKQTTTRDISANAPDAWISTYDALAAAVYQRIYQSRLDLVRRQEPPGDPSQVSTNYLLSVDVRTRMGLAAQQYFPNAVAIPFFSWPPPEHLVSSPSAELDSAPLHEIALTIHQISRVQSESELEDHLHWVAAQSDKSKITHKFGFERPGCLMSAWNKFESYDSMVMDGVRPSVVAAPFTPINLVDGLVYFLQTDEAVSEGEGGSSIDVYVALDDRLWDFFRAGNWLQMAECRT